MACRWFDGLSLAGALSKLLKRVMIPRTRTKHSRLVVILLRSCQVCMPQDPGNDSDVFWRQRRDRGRRAVPEQVRVGGAADESFRANCDAVVDGVVDHGRRANGYPET